MGNTFRSSSKAAWTLFHTTSSREQCDCAWTSLLKHLLAKLHWKIAGRQQIYTTPQQILEFDLKTAKIKKRGAWQCIYQQIKVTPPLYPFRAVLNQTREDWLYESGLQPRERLLVADQERWRASFFTFTQCSIAPVQQCLREVNTAPLVT
ncbi:hypothetical protein [Pseudomonas hormoni]